MDEHSRASRGFMKFAWVLGIVLTVLLLAILYLLLFPQTKFAFKDGPYEITNKDMTVIAGEFLYVESPGFCNYGVDTTIIRKLSNAYGSIELPTLRFNAPAKETCFEGGNGAVTPVLIPGEIPSGEWSIEFRTTYKANLIQSITISKTTPVFIVVNRDSAAILQ